MVFKDPGIDNYSEICAYIELQEIPFFVFNIALKAVKFVVFSVRRGRLLYIFDCNTLDHLTSYGFTAFKFIVGCMRTDLWLAFGSKITDMKEGFNIFKNFMKNCSQKFVLPLWLYVFSLNDHHRHFHFFKCFRLQKCQMTLVKIWVNEILDSNFTFIETYIFFDFLNFEISKLNFYNFQILTYRLR